MPTATLTKSMLEAFQEDMQIRLLIEEYDELFHICMTGPLTREEQTKLNELHEALSLLEQDLWRGSSDAIYALNEELFEMDFPMLRYELGMLTAADGLND